jgi:L-seryl-tRNA(Ser) seleniumtransferase
MLRVDKVTYYILQEILLKYVNEKGNGVELWNSILQDEGKVSARVSKLLRMIDSDKKKKYLKKISTTATYGGGTMPLSEIKSYGIEFNIPGLEPEKIYEHFISSLPPIAGTVKNDRFVLDLYTVFEKDFKSLTSSINELLRERG